jgi:hypothetical protein
MIMSGISTKKLPLIWFFENKNYFSFKRLSAKRAGLSPVTAAIANAKSYKGVNGYFNFTEKESEECLKTLNTVPPYSRSLIIKFLTLGTTKELPKNKVKWPFSVFTGS